LARHPDIFDANLRFIVPQMVLVVAADPAALRRTGLRDTRKRLWPFETRPNVLRKLDSPGELSFVELYRQTVQ
jgi:hypothetical protein